MVPGSVRTVRARKPLVVRSLGFGADAIPDCRGPDRIAAGGTGVSPADPGPARRGNQADSVGRPASTQSWMPSRYLRTSV